MESTERKKQQEKHNIWKSELKQRQKQWSNMSTEQKKQHYKTIISQYSPCSERNGYEEEMEGL